MRAEDWDERYGEKQQWSSEPNRLIADLLADLPPGDAVDLAAGEGRHALWLASHGWRATAVDFSGVGLDRGRAQPGSDAVTWVVADVRTWSAPDASLDLVLVAYLHLPQEETLPLFTRAVDWLRPGGRLLVLGHDVENPHRGRGRPARPGDPAQRRAARPGGGAAGGGPARADPAGDAGRYRARHPAVGAPTALNRRPRAVAFGP